jgi:CDP-glucose 4,6-dehydratase
MAPFDDLYRGRSVLVTGHTGFKGSWLTCWLQALGARVAGYALEPATEPSLFHLLATRPAFADHRGDIRDAVRLQHVFERVRPDTVFHLAAQPIVRRSYDTPLETLEVNAMGTATLLEAVRRAGRPCVVVIVTSDKCYENVEWVWGYREDDKLGGHDPYSVSKAVAELIVASWRRSFFSPARAREHGIRVASVRAGNVIGGGDWSPDRLVPDCIRALQAGDVIRVRNPLAHRPWQHVLEPLSGYLWLGARMAVDADPRLPDAWNFGPAGRDSRSVAELVDTLVDEWGSGSWQDISHGGGPHEAQQLSLACDKALQQLSWWPTWGFEQAVAKTVQWYRAWANAEKDLWHVCQRQIIDYTTDAQAQGVAWAAVQGASRRARVTSGDRRQALAALAGDSLLLLGGVL